MKENRSNSYWFIGYNLFILMMGTNLPTPLYSVYKHEMGFSAMTLTLIFAVYALMIIPSLLLFGQISDQIGRKKVLIPGMILAGLGSVLLAFASNVDMLILARAIQGLSVGIVSGAATAALSETHPRNDRKQAALVASVATAAGTAVGPFLAGLLAQYGPWPLVLPYILHLVLIVIGFIGLTRMVNVAGGASAGRWRPQKPGVPAEIRPTFMLAASTAFVAWAVTAIFMSLVPTLVAVVMQIHNLAVGGGLVFIMLTVSSITQLSMRTMKSRNSILVGLICLMIGLACVVGSIQHRVVWLLILGTIIAGFGQGLNFMGSLALVNQSAPAARRADVLSSFYVVIYLGVGVPILALGFMAQSMDLYHAVRIFTEGIDAVGIILCLAVLIKRPAHVGHLKKQRELES